MSTSTLRDEDIITVRSVTRSAAMTLFARPGAPFIDASPMDDVTLRAPTREAK